MAAMFFPRTLAAVALLALAPACAKPAPAGAKTSAQPQEEQEEKELFGRMTMEELDAKVKAAKAGQLELAIFDNNDRGRYERGHIPGAKWVKFDAVKAADLPASKDAVLVFYCANEFCSACHEGANAALKLGYKNVFILPTGIKGWEKANRPVEKS
jgi:rhodanese-related sulfurtransferase